MKSDIGQLQYVHIKLRRLIVWLEETTGVEFTETSRHRIGDPGCHGTLPVRADDLRCRHRGLGLFICKIINKAWIYDPKRPSRRCAIAHGKGSNFHIHIEVHPNTRKR